MLQSQLSKLFLVACMVTSGMLASAKPVAAQAIYPGSRQPVAPYRPKLSPYLDLLRTDNSQLNPYHSFVVPRRELYGRQARQAAEISRLGRSSYGRSAGRGSMQPRLPTGGGGRFQTYLHYYQFNNNRVSKPAN